VIIEVFLSEQRGILKLNEEIYRLRRKQSTEIWITQK